MNEELNPDVLEAPLVVHKKSDASYKETAEDVVMVETHLEDDGPSIKRHRYKKTREQKANKSFVFLLAIIVIAVAFGVVFAMGGFDKVADTKTTTQKQTTTELTTSIEQAYEGTIVIKGVYIFVDGVEVNGIEGLQQALKYEDKSTTAYTIISEDADASFLNDDILPLLMDMGFYDDKTEITHKVSTGLVAYEETTTTTTAQPSEENVEE